MQRQRKNTPKMLTALQTGDVVQTGGGIVGDARGDRSCDTVVLRVSRIT